VIYKIKYMTRAARRSSSTQVRGRSEQIKTRVIELIGPGARRPRAPLHHLRLLALLLGSERPGIVSLIS
jgi:hypothetical protein